MIKPILLTTVLASLSLLLGVAHAADICTYTSRSCAGSYGCCYGIAEGVCCYWPSNYGWSVRFQNMPLTAWWLGKTYGDMCSTQTSGIGSSSGSACSSVFNGPGYINWVSANWDADYRTRRRSIEGGEEAAGAGGDGNNNNCVLPNVIGFTTADGEEHLVKVPPGKFDEVNEFVKTENYNELLKLESAFENE